MGKRFLVGLACMVLLAGCAGAKNYNTEIDALNSRVASLQNQLKAKDREMGALSDQVRSLQSQLETSHKAQMDAERRLDQALARLASKSRTATSGYDKVSSDEFIK